MTDVKKTDVKDHEGAGFYGAATYNEYTFFEAPETDQTTRGFGGEFGVFYQNRFQRDSAWGFLLSLGVGFNNLTDPVTSFTPSNHSGYVPPEESTDGECHDIGHTGQCDEPENTDDDPETEKNNGSTNDSYKDVNDMSHYYLSLKALANVGVLNRSVIFHLGPELRLYNFYNGGDFLGSPFPDASLAVQGADGSLDFTHEVRFSAGGHGAFEVRPAPAISLFAGASVLAGTAEAFGSIVQASSLEDGAAVSNPGGTTRYASDILHWDATAGVKIYTDNIKLKEVGQFFQNITHININIEKKTKITINAATPTPVAVSAPPAPETEAKASAPIAKASAPHNHNGLKGDEKLQHLLVDEAEKRGITLAVLLSQCHFAKGYPFYSTEEASVIVKYTDGTPAKRVALQDDKIIELVAEAISRNCTDCGDAEEKKAPVATTTKTAVEAAPKITTEAKPAPETKPTAKPQKDATIDTSEGDPIPVYKAGDTIEWPAGSGKSYKLQSKTIQGTTRYYFEKDDGSIELLPIAEEIEF